MMLEHSEGVTRDLNYTCLSLRGWHLSNIEYFPAVACMICVLILAALPVAMIVIGECVCVCVCMCVCVHTHTYTHTHTHTHQ